MIKRYCFGKPIKTDAVVEDLAIEREYDGALSLKKESGKSIFSFVMCDKDIVYGLGQQVRGINKRGWKYRSYNLDDPVQVETRTSLYGAHNFLIIDGEKARLGLFFDTGDMVEYDIGYTQSDLLQITVYGDFALYYIEEKSLKEIVRVFRRLIGQSYIPPKWAFGYGQSRWGYKTAEDIRRVADGYQKNGFPIDMVYLDIDYMQDYKNFTINEERFPNFCDFVKEMKDRGIRLIPIIDAGVKVERGYSVYEEGRQKGCFCKDEKGEDFVVGVWPGDCVLPDFFSEKTRAWFGAQYKALLNCGIEGFWNDMNEPALFFSRGNLEEAIEYTASQKGKNLSVEEFQNLCKLFPSLANNEKDFRSFYHEINGGKVPHNKVHNLYGYNMTRSASEYFEKYSAKEKYLLISRSSSIGMHRYGGIWTGDNSAWWSHIGLLFRQLPALNMCGFLFVGADLGGFAHDTTEDLMLRFLALGVFVPLMRNHSTPDSREQELYLFPQKETFRNFIKIRYALLPYLYTEFVRCAKEGDMLFRPLAFDYPNDRRAKSVEDQLMFGNALMLAPVFEQNARGRYVYLPERMKLVKMRSPEIWTEEILEKGDYYIEIALNEIPFFIKESCVLPLADPKTNVETTDFERVKYITF